MRSEQLLGVEKATFKTCSFSKHTKLTAIRKASIPQWAVALASVSRNSTAIHRPETAQIFQNTALDALKAKGTTIKRMGQNSIRTPGSTSVGQRRGKQTKCLSFDDLTEQHHETSSLRRLCQDHIPTVSKRPAGSGVVNCLCRPGKLEEEGSIQIKLKRCSTY